jgi:hypothetical protein
LTFEGKNGKINLFENEIYEALNVRNDLSNYEVYF